MHVFKYIAATSKEFALYSHIVYGIDRRTGNEKNCTCMKAMEGPVVCGKSIRVADTGY